MDRWRGRVAVVTGASAGIGAAVCEDLVGQGMVVVGLARREDRLQELKNQLQGKQGTFHYVKCDITKTDEVKAAFKWVDDNLGGVDVLVNNAAANLRAPFTDVDMEVWRSVYDTNIFAVGACSKEAIRSMRERHVDGQIIVINSFSGHKPPQPNAAVYASSKHAVRIITDGLKRDLVAQKSKIKVTSLSPGLVDTELFEKGNINIDVSQFAHLKPKDLAETVRYVISTPPHVQIHELMVRATDDDMTPGERADVPL